jgi:hypothetical protein
LAYQLTGNTFMLLVNTKDAKAYSQFITHHLRAIVADFKTFPIGREVKTFARLDYEDIKTVSKRLESVSFS